MRMTSWIIVTLLTVAAGFEPSGSRAQDEKPGALRTMRVTVLGSDGKPLPGATIHAAIWSPDPVKSNRDYVCDSDGKASVELPKTIEILRLWARHDGHVALFANWWPAREPNPREIPREFTFQLDRGTTIGGAVQDEDGKPIAGAKVAVQLVNPNGEKGLDRHPIPDIWLAEGDTSRTTDAQGRWSLDTAPGGDEFGFRIMLTHPDFVSDSTWGGYQQQQGVGAESLRKQTATITMPRGTELSGIVTDADGKPIPDAVVVWGNDPYFEPGSQEVRTDAQGRYTLPPLPSGELRVTAVAKGWMPSQRVVDLAPGEATAEFVMKPGQRLRLHFVDDTGKPVPGVAVGIEQWRGSRALYNHKHPNVLDTKIPVLADENGLYEWTWAPDDAVTFNVHKDGYQDARSLIFTPDSTTEFEVVMPRTR